jgi:hypothetical protein
MRISLLSRAARASAAAATLVFSLGLAPSFAHMGAAPGARPAFGFGHPPHFGSRGFNRRFDFDRLGFDRFGARRFDRFGFNRFNRFGFDRFGANRWNGWNQFAIGGWGWGGWDGWGGGAVSTGASEPIIVGDGAPVIINISADSPLRGGADAGGCVTHKLIYDSAGRYVGERQSPQC